MPLPRERPMWAMTAYFNPIGYGSRLRNYRRFRRALAVPLIAVELGYHDQFELTAADADILIRVTGTDMLWQKERLLNLALAHLPPHVDHVAWLDCDVVLERPDWPEAAVDLLRRTPLVQLFSELHDLPEHALPPAAGEPRQVTGHAIAYLMTSRLNTVADLDPSVALPRARQRAWGLAWAARRELLARHRFYDAMVVGSGDRVLAYAAYGRADSAVVITKMSPRQSAHYRQWADPFSDAVGGRIGCVDGRLFHLWHGDFQHRQYRERHELFAAYQFDPSTDLVMNATGVYEWAPHRRHLAEFCRAYFASRREDGIDVADAVPSAVV